MDRKAKQAEIFDKLGSIVFGKNLTSWDQLITFLRNEDDKDLKDYAYEHAYLIQQWFNENRRK